MAKKPVSTSSPKTQSKSNPSPAQKSGSEGNWLTLGFVVLAITAACYLPTLRHDFVNWDDQANITENANLLQVGKGQAWTTTLANIFDIEKGNVIGNYNPLTILTFAIEKSLAGGEFSPGLTHFNNLLLHLVTVFFAMKLLLGMGIGRWGVFAGGLLFGIHPMRVESVAWATERKDVLFAMFFFWALLYYVKWLKQEEKGESRTKTYVIMLLLALLSCLSKVQAVALPLSMLALDLWFRRPMSFKLIWEKTPFWLISLAFGLINLYTLSVQGSTDDSVTKFEGIDKLFIGAYSYCTYLYKLVFPYPMSPLYSYPKSLPWTAYASPAGVALVIAGLVWAWKKGQRAWVFGLLFFTFNVMFVLQIFAAGQGFLADRFTYVAYFGLFAIIAYYVDLFSKNESSKPKVFAALGAVALICSIWTVRQVGVWKDGYTLWTHIMGQNDGKKEVSLLPYWNRAQILNKRGDFAAALLEYDRALEIDPNNPDLMVFRGKACFNMASSEKFKSQQKSLLEKSINAYTQAISMPKATAKTKADALIGRGAAYGFSGMYQQCIQDITQGIQLDPTNKSAYSNRSFAYMSTGQYENALNDYREYLKIDPNNADFWYESGLVERSLKRYNDAIKSLDQAIKLNPKLGLAYLERARSKALSGNLGGAQQDYQKAQQLGQNLMPMDQQWMGGGQ
jgi:tetratricopeptide (TPR) repeat protein